MCYCCKEVCNFQAEKCAVFKRKKQLTGITTLLLTITLIFPLSCTILITILSFHVFVAIAFALTVISISPISICFIEVSI